MRTLALVMAVHLVTIAGAVTYYVDAENGNDANTGLSETAAWSTIAKSVSSGSPIEPGDTVLVRQGIYREQVSIKRSGTEGHRIVIKNYPGESPVLDGSEMLTGWTACVSQSDALENGNWANIHKVAASGLPSGLRMMEDGTIMTVAQWPDQADGAFQDVHLYVPLDSAEVVDGEGNETVTDYLIDMDFSGPQVDYTGATILVWTHRANNAQVSRTITACTYSNGGTDVRFDFDTPLSQPLTTTVGTSPDAYALQNHPALISRAGEYHYTTPESTEDVTVYFWPLDASDLAEKISYLSINYGMYAADYMHYQGLTYRGFTSQAIRFPVGSNDLYGFKFTDNTVHTCAEGVYLYHPIDLEIRRCTVHTMYSGNGIQVLSGTNVLVDSCHVYNTNSTRIKFTGTDYGIVSNCLINNTTASTHGNGMSYYEQNNDILLFNNTIDMEGSALTFRYSNVTVFQNLILDGTISEWASDSTKRVDFFNNTMTAGPGVEKSGTIRFINNISGGYGNTAAVRAHNCYLSMSWTQSSKYGWEMETGGFFADGENGDYDWDDIFADTSARDFTLADGSPCLETGADISAYIDTLESVYPGVDFDRDMTGAAFGPTRSIGCFAPDAVLGVVVSGPPPAVRRGIPNPVRASRLRQYTGIRVFTLNGNMADIGRIRREGLYMVRTDDGLYQPVIITK